MPEQDIPSQNLSLFNYYVQRFEFYWEVKRMSTSNVTFRLILFSCTYTRQDEVFF